MTIYYIDPENGNDSNSGASWVQAWKTLRGLRVASVVPGAGDEIRFAKSTVYTPTAGTLQKSEGTGIAIAWYLRGVKLMDSDEAGGDSTVFHVWYRTSVVDLHRLKCLASLFINGSMTIDVPSWADDYNNNYFSTHAVCNDGSYKNPSHVLFGGGVPGLNLMYAEGLGLFQGAIRCSVPYTGTTGDIDLPAGSIEVSLYNGATLICTATVGAIRNSFDEWTPFEIDFTPLSYANYPNLKVIVSRTAVAINRDDSPFGLEISQIGLAHPLGESIGITDTLLSLTRTAFSPSTSSLLEVVGTTDMSILLERVNAIDEYSSGGGNSVFSADGDNLKRVGTTPDAYIRCFKVPDIAMTGRTPASPAGSLGVYDLNGSAGGTTIAPLKVSGGWNTSTDVVEGVTAFSAGLIHQFSSSFAWLDLQGATNVQFDNLAVAYGFGSFVTRPGTISFNKCMLPFSLKPAFGTADGDTNVTLKNMCIAPLVLENFGTIGDLTLDNTFYTGYKNTSVEKRNEVNNFSMYGSQFGAGRRVTYVRGDGVLDQCTLLKPPQLSSTQFGHTLVFKNHVALPSTNISYLIPTTPDSRWDVIDYQDESMPTYSFGTPAATGATCDAKIIMRSALLISPTLYPTALRGNDKLHVYTDGRNDFLSTAYLQGSAISQWGYKYSHVMTQRPKYTYNLETPNNIDGANLGEVATPPWYVELDRSTSTQTLVQNTKITASARLFLANKFSDVTYRTNDSVYVVSGKKGVAKEWTTLKAIYVPKAGMYRAHFGAMVMNINFTDIGSSTFVYNTPRMGSFRTDSGIFLGRFGVFSAKMVSLQKIIDYYAPKYVYVPETDEYVYEDGSNGNMNLDTWKDFYIDFDMSSAGLVELRQGSADYGITNGAIFDVLEIYERQ